MKSTNSSNGRTVEISNIRLETSGSGGDDPTPSGEGGYKPVEDLENGLPVGTDLPQGRSYYVNLGTQQNPQYVPVNISNDQYFSEQNNGWTVDSGNGKYYLPAGADTSKEESFLLVSQGTGTIYTPHSGEGVRTILKSDGDGIHTLSSRWAIPTTYYWRDNNGVFHKVYGETHGVLGKWTCKFYYYNGTAPVSMLDSEDEWNAIADQFTLIGDGPDFGLGNPSVSQTFYTAGEGVNRLVYSGGDLPGSTPRTILDPEAVVYTGPLYEKSTGYGATKISYVDNSGNTVTVENFLEGYALLRDKDGNLLADQTLYWFDPAGQSDAVTPNQYDSDPELGEKLDENTNFDGNLFLKKGLYFDKESGTYGIKLESWATGTAKQVEEAEPMDIVLVLDQSATMGNNDLSLSYTVSLKELYYSQSTTSGYYYTNRTPFRYNNAFVHCYDNGDGTYSAYEGPKGQNKLIVTGKGDVEINVTTSSRLQGLRAAVARFVYSLSQKVDENNNPLYRVAMVGFASSEMDSQNQYQNTEVFNGATEYNYNTNITKEQYQSSLKWTDVAGVQDLMKSAITLNDSGQTNVQLGMELAKNIFASRDDDTKDRATAVVLFTDGSPGNDNFGSGKIKGYEIANEAIHQSYLMKTNYNTTVYAIGLLSSDSGTLADQPSGASYTINNFMNYVSSNYNEAESLEEHKDRNDDGIEYYQITNANSTAKLDELFRAIAKNISDTDVTVNDESVLQDIINTNNLDIGNAKMKASTVEADQIDHYKNIHWKEKTVDGVKMEDEVVLQAETALTGSTVSVNGFDYTGEYTAYNETDQNHHKYGKKLIVRISGLKPEQGGEALLSNTAAGIYNRPGDPEPFLDVDSPDYTIPIVSKVIDFNKKMSFGANSSEDLYKTKGTNGTFALESDNLTYQLKYNGTDTTTIDGVGLVMGAYDTTMTYEEKPAGTKGEVLKQTPGWTQFYAVPANNVYFDDEFLTGTSSTVDVGDGSGRNTGVSSSSVSTTTGTTSFAITFTGKRIDIYCTTDATKNGLTATLTKDGSRVMFVANNAPDSANRFTVQNQFDDTKALTNVPTLSIVPEDGFGTYTVNLTATAGFRLDGVRVYNPVEETDEVVKKAYSDELEQNAVFQPVRALLLEQSKVEAAVTTAEDESVNGAVYIESNYQAEESASLAVNYEKAGPKNEVYLDPGNAVGVQIHADGFKPGYQVWVGLSAPAGKSATVKVSGWDAVNDRAASYEYNVTSNVDMYYPVVPDANGNVYVYNASGEDGGMISVTNIKITGEQKLLFGAAANPAAKFTVNRSLMSYARTFDALEVVDPDATTIPDPIVQPSPDPEPTAEPDPEPTQTPTIGEIVQQIISSFVSLLFGSIASLFGH